MPLRQYFTAVLLSVSLVRADQFCRAGGSPPSTSPPAAWLTTPPSPHSPSTSSSSPADWTTPARASSSSEITQYTHLNSNKKYYFIYWEPSAFWFVGYLSKMNRFVFIFRYIIFNWSTDHWVRIFFSEYQWIWSFGPEQRSLKWVFDSWRWPISILHLYLCWLAAALDWKVTRMEQRKFPNNSNSVQLQL